MQLYMEDANKLILKRRKNQVKWNIEKAKNRRPEERMHNIQADYDLLGLAATQTKNR